MKRFKPLALSLSLLFASIPAAHAAAEAFSVAPTNAGNDAGLAAGLDMMQQNASLLRNGDNVWERIRQGFQMAEVNPELVKKQERAYLSRPDLFKRSLERSHKYLFYILSEVERRGMPTEIALLPMVESAFVPTAASPVGAAGLWQFMPVTGRQYGLEQTWWYDGRRDVTAATDAALDYLQNLYTQFGDWSLALAAYNWGEGNLSRSIARTLASGQPATYENVKMPAETRNYVPKLLAVRNLLDDPASFGLHLDKFPNKPYFVTVNPERHMDISLAARLAGISVSEFMELNPAFNLPVYAYKAGRQMLLPASKVDRFEANLAKWDKPLLTWQVYTPATTEAVADVATRVGMSSSQLMSVNHVNGTTLSAGRPVLVAMKSGADDIRTLTLTDSQPVMTASDSATAVKPATTGETAVRLDAQNPNSPAILPRTMTQAPVLTATAQPTPVMQTVAPTPALHDAPVTTTLTAQTTTETSAPALPASAAPAVTAQAIAMASPADTSTEQSGSQATVKIAMATPVPQMAQAAASPTQHTVVAGDTLYNISHRYNLTVAELKALNGLHGNSLKLGQVLQLKSKPARQADTVQGDTSQNATPVSAAPVVPAQYVVQRGDTVYSIARHFGIDHAVILHLNDPRKLVRLQPGQVVNLQGM
jgi:membrane-bound lytic murein transglycosylase D